MTTYAKYYDYITGTGVIVPDTSSIITDVQNEWKEVFGNDLSVEPETPQGRIIEMIARQRVFTIQMAAALSNILNLNKAYGFILDDIGSLFQLSRKSATYTTTQITMSGVADTVIPVGTELMSDEGYKFINDDEYIIGSDGSVTGIFRAEESGNIPAQVGSITTIVSAVAGLESVINNASASVGQEQESDQEFRNRIKNSLNINSTSVLSAIKSAVANVDGVNQVVAYENTSDTASILNDIFSIPAHGFGIVVDYDESDLANQTVANNIAGAIYNKKTLGAGQISANDGNASITQTVGDSLSDLTVNTATFENEVDGVWGIYNFTYDGSNWVLSDSTVDLTDYGITYTGTPVENDTIKVSYPEGQEYIITIDYPDINDGQGHNITFAKPKEKNVYTTITVQKRTYAGDDLEADIKNAIANFLNGNNPEVDRVNIGGTLSPFEIASAISSEISDIFIVSVTIGLSAGVQAMTPIQLGSAEKLVINPENITVVIND